MCDFAGCDEPSDDLIDVHVPAGWDVSSLTAEATDDAPEETVPVGDQRLGYCDEHALVYELPRGVSAGVLVRGGDANPFPAGHALEDRFSWRPRAR